MPPRKGDGISRIERAEMARALKDKGFYHREIAEKLGISMTYVGALLSDPDGSHDRARKEKYRGTCVVCGGKTTYSKPKEQVQRCINCEKQRRKAERKWTPERMIADLKRWNLIYGRPPKAQEWLQLPPSGGDREWPNVESLQREFGSWSNGLRAAGFEPRVSYERTPEWKEKVSKWPRETILQSLRDWAEEHGRPPTSTEWRYAGDDRPSYSCVFKRFGSWNKALREAGLSTLAPGQQRAKPLRAVPDKPYASIPFEERVSRSLLEVVADLRKEAV